MSWYDTLQAAKQRGKFTFNERMAACNRGSCAVSERDVALLQTSPSDPIIAKLGLDFAAAVDHQEVDRAEEIYERICVRTKAKA